MDNKKEIRDSVIEKIEEELHYGIIMSDLDIRLLNIESVNPDLDKKRIENIESGISKKKAEKEWLEQRLSLLNFYKK